MIRIHQVKCQDPKDLEAQILKKLNIPKKDLLSWKIHRKSVDARGQKVLFSYIVDAEVRNEKKHLKKKDVFITPDETFRFEPTGTKPLKSRPVIAGFGPAGLFAALLLIQYGYRPIILERGSEIDKRSEDVQKFWKQGLLNPESNVQFGMGGAGAFSDGKLTSRSKDIKSRKVYEELVSLGADEEILIEQHPHVGTDGFVKILKNARKRIEEQGGTFLFDTRLDGIETENGHLSRILLSDRTTLPCQALILATGHSASDTLKKLHEQGLELEAKPFAVGVRIEHLQTFINQAMLHEQAKNPLLIPARYQITHTDETGHGVYSFCMCPGGYVIASSCEPDTVVVNGMSYAARDGVNANAALLVQVKPEDLEDDLFAGLRLQEELEKKAWEISKDYKAPVQLASDFLEGKTSTAFGEVKPTYEPGVVFADFNEILPEFASKALHSALKDFEHKVPGFTKDALMTGVETRSSSSLRIPRDAKTLNSSISGLWPCGEGAGYSGGIVTSAIDGLRCAMSLMDTFDKPKEADLK